MQKAAIAAVFVLASLPVPIATAQPARTDVVPVYDPTEVAYDRYVVVRRIGVEGNQSAFRIPGHPDLEKARAAVTGEAARLGADGVINLKCFDQTDRIRRHAGYFCYGNAIQFKNERRVK